MADFTQIKEVRLTVKDPDGVINIIQGAAPPTPVPQTAYTENGQYTIDGERVDIFVSDDRISAWIDAGGVNYAIYNSVLDIMAGIPRRMEIARVTGGAESTEWQSLDQLRKWYLFLIDKYKTDTQKHSTGVYRKTVRPEVAGGDI